MSSSRYDKDDRDLIIDISDRIRSDLYKWGRMTCTFSIGANRIYISPYFGVHTFYAIAYPDEWATQTRYYYQKDRPNWLQTIVKTDAKWSPYLFNFKPIQWLLRKYQKTVYGLVYKKYLTRFPRFRHVLYVGAGNPELISGAIDYIKKYNMNSDSFK
jgi:hypothetical protein